MTKQLPVNQLVIAVDAVRRGRTGPYIAAAVAFQEGAVEPLFHFTDGRGVRRAEYLLRDPSRVKKVLVPAVLLHVRRLHLDVCAFSLPREKAPKDVTRARLVAMYWAVRKLADKLRHFHAETAREREIHLRVAGNQPLQTKQFAGITQSLGSCETDWHLQAARFTAYHAFQETP